MSAEGAPSIFKKSATPDAIKSISICKPKIEYRTDSMVPATYRPLLWDSGCAVAKSAGNFFENTSLV